MAQLKYGWELLDHWAKSDGRIVNFSLGIALGIGLFIGGVVESRKSVATATFTWFYAITFFAIAIIALLPQRWPDILKWLIVILCYACLPILFFIVRDLRREEGQSEEGAHIDTGFGIGIAVGFFVGGMIAGACPWLPYGGTILVVSMVSGGIVGRVISRIMASNRSNGPGSEQNMGHSKETKKPL